MVNPDSDLYRSHPDWVFNFPTRTRHEQRNQLMLNLARQDVYDYLLDAMTKLLSQNNIKFIKWDRNRGLSEPGWPDAPPELAAGGADCLHAESLRTDRHVAAPLPEVMFEDCSGGGGRAGPRDASAHGSDLAQRQHQSKRSLIHPVRIPAQFSAKHHGRLGHRRQLASRGGVDEIPLFRSLDGRRARRRRGHYKWSEADRDTAKKMIAPLQGNSSHHSAGDRLSTHAADSQRSRRSGIFIAGSTAGRAPALHHAAIRRPAALMPSGSRASCDCSG